MNYAACVNFIFAIEPRFFGTTKSAAMFLCLLSKPRQCHAIDWFLRDHRFQIPCKPYTTIGLSFQDTIFGTNFFTGSSRLNSPRSNKVISAVMFIGLEIEQSPNRRDRESRSNALEESSDSRRFTAFFVRMRALVASLASPRSS